MTPEVLRDVVFLYCADISRRHFALAEKCLDWCYARGPNRQIGRWWASEARRHADLASHWADLAIEAAALLTG